MCENRSEISYYIGVAEIHSVGIALNGDLKHAVLCNTRKPASQASQAVHTHWELGGAGSHAPVEMKQHAERCVLSYAPMPSRPTWEQ